MELTKKKKVALCCIVSLLALAGCWFYFAGRGDVSDIGKSADDVKEELTDAADTQRREAETLDRATEAVDNSRSAIRDSQETVDRIQGLERSDAEIIRESQSILSEVRKRGKTQNPGED